MLAAYWQLPRVVYVLCVGTFINRAGTLLIPFLTIYMKDQLGGGVAFATLAMGVFGFGSVLGQTVGGHLADRIGRRRVMLLALFGGAALMSLLALLHTPLLFLAGTFALAFVSEMLRPAVQAMMADVVPPLQRPYSFGLMYVSINLGFALGPTIGGLLAEHSFQLIFFADAAASCAYALIVLMFVPESRPAPRAESSCSRPDEARHDAANAEPTAAQPALRDLGFFGAMRIIAEDRTFVALCVAAFLLALVFMQSMSTFPLYLQQLGYRPATYGWIIAVNGWLIVLLQVPVTAWLAGFPRARLLVLAALLTGAGFGLQGLAQYPWQFAATVAIWTLGEIVQAPLIGPILADLAPPDLRGRYMGVFGMSFSGANMLGAPLGGLVLAHLGPAYVWGACVVLALAAAAIYWRIGRMLVAGVSRAPRGSGNALDRPAPEAAPNGA